MRFSSSFEPPAGSEQKTRVKPTARFPPGIEGISPDLLRKIRRKKPGEKVQLTIIEPEVKGTKDVSVELQDLERFWIEVASKREEKQGAGSPPQP